ncbi:MULTISPECIES: protein-methionine-sulfoxide reductase heme-binding subunit MsrQ [Providencia]|uniref:Protein-methionine-sulfoxide reductase heme-binding subunit MsrQ n=1 Tax=Providencia alcalifaciens 205/92 TaxID=1256988 RepID=A0AAV3MAQ7_9GAMM|nr:MULTISPECIES: protein-methionine-sulfoxide reductase heme-binding subunit MsrQ [Providencia]EUD12879.1 putative membrane protein YedZ [Providencia alcalifaciens 205/92]MTC16339.1 sulfoxide reductase heme-binding subunit YedZ [Providencia alcalifaciens]MTC39628.1 sulfoxide reductase heme-binding subunit YedZ [Providencia alcalifaciens]MTC63505.1 sulfoxide reductase heme-binding subunit YedZ [Providencia alcalifaciens]QLQ97680.1 sulfoxide reductase heme-binding subunit YedZ [Providencia alcal
MPQDSRLIVALTKGSFHLIALLPLAWLIFLIDAQRLGADPAKDIQHFTGIAALRLLLIIVLIPLAARLLRFTALFQTRKLLGLWCFFWAVLHLTSYLLLEIGINNLALFFEEVFSRVYLVIGATAWLCLFLMAVSSFNRIRMSLGVWWKRIHMLLYPTLLLALCHYALSLKTLTPEPIIYLVLVGSAFAYRVWNQQKQQIKP